MSEVAEKTRERAKPTHAAIPLFALELLVVSALIFSTGALFVRSLDRADAWSTVFWRSVAAGISLCLVILWRDRSNPLRAMVAMGPPGWSVAASFSISSISMVVALTRTSVAIVLVIFALSPLFAAVMAWFLIRERIQNYTWTAIAVTVLGVGYMVSGQGRNGSITGVLVALTIPLAFGYGTVIIRKHAEIAMAPAMLLSTIFSCIVALPFASPLAVTRHDLLILLAFGFAQLGVGLAIFSIGAAQVPATDVALISMLEPIMGPIWVWLFRNEYPGVAALIGGGVVFSALAIHTLYAARANPA